MIVVEIIYTAETFQSASTLFDSLFLEFRDALNKVQKNNYGKEFISILICPIIMPSDMQADYKERKFISRKKHEADIRLHVDYYKFVQGKLDINRFDYLKQRRLLLTKNIVDSIMVIEKRKKDDFQGERLIEDILEALNVSREELSEL